MPGMKGQAPTNPYEGMWGPIGAGNAAPYGGNTMPWLNQGSLQPQNQSIFARLFAQRNQGQGQQNPNAAFNRPQFPGQGMPQGQPFLGLQNPIMGNANNQAVPQMAAASSMAPSQPQELIARYLQSQQLMQPQMAQGAMMGGNIPPNAMALQNQVGMMAPAVQPERYELPESQAAQQSIAPSSGSIFNRKRQAMGG